MPLLSAFTPFGLMECSNRPSPAEQIFRALVAAYGKEYSVVEGTHLGAKCYATAMRLASVAATVERGANQKDPLLTREMLSAMERQYGIVPSPGESHDDRRHFLAAKYLAARGSSPNNVLLAMTLILGAGLRAITYPVGTPYSEFGAGVFTRDDAIQNRYTFVDHVTTLGVASEFRYAPEVSGERLKVGDVVSAQYGNLGLAEKVTITAVREALPTERDKTSPRATTTFYKVKEAGASIWTGARPYWMGTARYTLIVATAAAARDPELRRKVDEIMSLIMTGVSTWALVEETTTGHVGPFALGTSYLGTTTLGDVSY